MKRLLHICLWILLLGLIICTAQAEDTYYLTTPNATEKIALREAPDAKATLLGNYYFGTPLAVLSEENGWAQVQIGNEDGGMVGYVPSANLAWHIDTDMSSGHVYYANLQSVTGSTILRTAPSGNAQSIGMYANSPYVALLGEINDWCHILLYDQYPRVTGFVPASAITGKTLRTVALVNNSVPTDRLNLRNEPSSDARVLGKYYSGNIVYIDGIKGNYAKVTIGNREGYMALEYLLLYPHTPLDVPSAMAVATLTKSAKLYYSPESGTSTIATYPKGTLMTIHADIGNWCHVSIGEQWGYIEAANLQKTGDMAVAGSQFSKSLGYGITCSKDGRVPYYTVPGAQGDGYSYYGDNRTLELVADVGDYYQTYCIWGGYAFVAKENVHSYWFGDIMNQDWSNTLTDGTYTVGKDLPEGVYTFSIAAGFQGNLHIDGEGICRSYVAQGSTSYTVYLPKDAVVNISGGTLHKPSLEMAFTSENNYTFSGSGKFIAGLQLPIEDWAYDRVSCYNVSAAYGAQGSFYVISTLDQEAGVVEMREKVHLERNQSVIINLLDGEFVEFYNCDVYATPGNG